MLHGSFDCKIPYAQSTLLAPKPQLPLHAHSFTVSIAPIQSLKRTLGRWVSLSLSQHPLFHQTVGTVCLFLAGKSDENARKVRDVVNATFTVRHRSLPPLQVGKEYWSLRDAVMATEPLLLRSLKYDVEVSLPHPILLNILYSLEASDELVSISWAILSDCVVSAPLMLVWKPNSVACGVVWLAAKVLPFALPEGQRSWWAAWGVCWEELEGVVGALLECFSN